MGLDVTASHVIWFVALLGVATGAVAGFLRVEASLQQAETARDVIDAEKLHAFLGNATFCYDGSVHRVVVNATNAGDVRLDATNVTLVVNGSVAAGFAIANQDGANTSVWAPGDWVHFTLGSVATDPQNLALVTEHGALVRATKVSCPYLASIVVTPGSASMPVGATQDFTAAGYDQYGQPFAVPAFSWSATTGSVSTLNATSARLASGTTSGSYTLTASYATVSASVPITLAPLAPASVVVTPGGAGVAAGGTQAFVATAYDAYGNVNSSASIAWATNAGSITSGGVLTAQTTAASGKSVTATTNGVSGAATVDVVAAAPASVAVSPATVTVQVGGTQAFAATVRDAYGNVNATASVAWTTNAGAIGTGGVLTAQTTAASGRTVTATAGAASGSATVTVSPGPPASVTLLPASATIPAGSTQTFSATLVDSYGNVNSTATATWSTSAGSITAGGVLTAPTVAPTSVTVTATSGAASSTASVSVQPAAPASVAVSPSSATLLVGGAQSFAATVKDQYGNVNATAPVAWSATRGSITSAGAYTAPTTTGSDTVTATSGSATGTASVTVKRALHIATFGTYSSGVLTTTFNRGQTVETRLTLVDNLGHAVSGLSTTITLTDPSAGAHAVSGSTNAGGFLSLNFTIPNPAANKGAWTDATTSMTLDAFSSWAATAPPDVAGSDSASKTTLTVN